MSEIPVAGDAILQEVTHSDLSAVLDDNSKNQSMSQIQKKYQEERAKRIRADGTAQYIDLSKQSEFQHYQDDPWLDPNAPKVDKSAVTDGSRCKHLIIGAGFGGLVLAVRLMDAGIPCEDIRMVDSAGGYGGTWYWNRYPGLMCDTESYIYMPLLEETGYVPKHKYAYGSELREHAEKIADKWNLKDKTLFEVETKKMSWDEAQKEWVVEISKKGDSGKECITVRSQFVFLASGLLNVPKLPGLKGVEDFKGHSFHTSRWDYSYTGGSPTDTALTNLADKRVGIIGTGATAIQAIPHLAKWAKDLYIFQRTPSSVDVRGQRETDMKLWNTDVATKAGWQTERTANFNGFVSAVDPPPSVNMVDDGWTRLGTYSALVGGPVSVTPDQIPAYIGGLHERDIPRQARVRARVEEIVKDKNTAEKLKPW
jgi:cation diffusion facilitator CzcD-associated flavoprotein CzcO